MERVVVRNRIPSLVLLLLTAVAFGTEPEGLEIVRAEPSNS